MARTEHYHDPNAPRANSIVVAVSVFVRDNHGRVLLIHRTDNNLWSLPGGGQEIGETVAQTAVRETREETGITVEVTDIVGVYSDPGHVIAYSNGEVRQQFSLCFRATPVDGVLTTSDESSDVRWVSRDELDGYTIHPSTLLRIAHGYEERREPYIG
ncbi:MULTISPECIES: NUDIX domain-containing protein [Micromonospora]|uniref:NUDIX domain-containing protein n=1 Tax=Micromonospora solifontis TaxID=2487138 RepID=A0ABX9WMI2_9ACTN|nr:MULTISPECIES: NUDIX domain-containing protein [Micromonospora]NES13267.1 NUDIX domain-containing protein [Micromonospora sp. PPF5-17B]NES34636.1 NUDIX domain-containing protein [Micromonospora solifontis]NES57000.1 NUDIX domain-containing protein [Micromonospora sp. PPF5-6]RNM01879.1 NUDIX domain-containing protein [Micromonospora solifontis]